MYNMPIRISNDTRNQVIREWLAGEPRDKIASDTELAAGTISNIIRDWRHDLGYPTADALRQFSIDLKRLGISTTDCAIGFRTVNIIKRLGLAEANEEKGLESFVSNIYNKCKYYGLMPDKLVILATQILDLLESMPLSQIPNYVEEKSKDKQKLEEEIKNLLGRKSSAQLEYEEALRKKKITIDMLQEFTHMQDTLIEYDLSTEDIPNLVNALKNAQQLGYDANSIADKISTIESLEEKEKELNNNLMMLQDELCMLKHAISLLDQDIDKHQRILTEYNKLQNIGFGLRELILLNNTLQEIATSNNIDSSMAVKKFFQDIEEKNALTKTVDELRQEKKRIDILIDSQFNNARIFIESFGQEAKKDIADIFNISTQNLQAIQLQTLQTVKEADTIIKSLNTEVKTQFEEIQKLGSSQEFSALIRAAKGDNSVNLEELKYAGIKTIDIIMSRLSDDDYNNNSSNKEIKESLERARISLQSKSS
jgi:hypothetical protein